MELDNHKEPSSSSSYDNQVQVGGCSSTLSTLSCISSCSTTPPLTPTFTSPTSTPILSGSLPTPSSSASSSSSFTIDHPSSPISSSSNDSIYRHRYKGGHLATPNKSLLHSASEDVAMATRLRCRTRSLLAAFHPDSQQISKHTPITTTTPYTNCYSNAPAVGGDRGGGGRSLSRCRGSDRSKQDTASHNDMLDTTRVSSRLLYEDAYSSTCTESSSSGRSSCNSKQTTKDISTHNNLHTSPTYTQLSSFLPTGSSYPSQLIHNQHETPSADHITMDSTYSTYPPPPPLCHNDMFHTTPLTGRNKNNKNHHASRVDKDEAIIDHANLYSILSPGISALSPRTILVLNLQSAFSDYFETLTCIVHPLTTSNIHRYIRNSTINPPSSSSSSCMSHHTSSHHTDHRSLSSSPLIHSSTSEENIGPVHNISFAPSQTPHNTINTTPLPALAQPSHHPNNPPSPPPPSRSPAPTPSGGSIDLSELWLDYDYRWHFHHLTSYCTTFPLLHPYICIFHNTPTPSHLLSVSNVDLSLILKRLLFIRRSFSSSSLVSSSSHHYTNGVTSLPQDIVNEDLHSVPSFVDNKLMQCSSTKSTHGKDPLFVKPLPIYNNNNNNNNNKGHHNTHQPQQQGEEDDGQAEQSPENHETHNQTIITSTEDGLCSSEGKRVYGETASCISGQVKCNRLDVILAGLTSNTYDDHTTNRNSCANTNAIDEESPRVQSMLDLSALMEDEVTRDTETVCDATVPADGDGQLDHLDQLDQLDHLDQLDQLDQLDRLDTVDKEKDINLPSPPPESSSHHIPPLSSSNHNIYLSGNMSLDYVNWYNSINRPNGACNYGTALPSIAHPCGTVDSYNDDDDEFVTRRDQPIGGFVRRHRGKRREVGGDKQKKGIKKSRMMINKDEIGYYQTIQHNQDDDDGSVLVNDMTRESVEGGWDEVNDIIKTGDPLSAYYAVLAGHEDPELSAYFKACKDDQNTTTTTAAVSPSNSYSREMNRRDASSSVKGVSFVRKGKHEMWVAAWSSASGKTGRAFSAHKYGFDGARELAENARRKAEETGDVLARQGRTARYQSGLPGVYWNDMANGWMGMHHYPNGTKKSRTFKLSKYGGFEGALKRAEQFKECGI
eukprot:GHVQ01020320.1.p1 GENE.GHVQ01020320.1~~GHVQ01020320.1.p1  ORF type:complete len:1118 (+),score=252.30 GHVQ01020320.1:395-3748(+)